VLELTHNHGTESDPDYKVTNGNSEPGKGFGHICVSVDNLQAACARLEDAGVKFQKKLSDGRMRHVAFALDPDGYWVELISAVKSVEETEGVTETDVSTYRFNHTMIRVKDKDASLKFYTEKLGMSLIASAQFPKAEFDLFFLAYAPDSQDPARIKEEEARRSLREGVLELTYNYGTEKQDDFKYHNGNEEPYKGFGHIGISVEDLEVESKRLEEKGVSFKKKSQDGKMKDIVFVLDPDGYWIELFQSKAYGKGAEFWDKLQSP
jgi:lactoylglutathione lyase